MTTQPQRTRKDRALATRRRMLRAGYRLFCERGYLATTMDAIAAEAGVAVQTLYFTFHTKGAILGETLGAAILGFDAWTGPPREPFHVVQEMTRRMVWWPAFAAEASPRRALDLLVDEGSAALWRAGALLAAVRGSGDPDATAVFELAERRRVESFREFVRTLARKQGGLRPGLTAPRATDILLVLFSGATYHELHTRRGWSHAECARFLKDVLGQQLLGEGKESTAGAAPRAPRRRTSGRGVH